MSMIYEIEYACINARGRVREANQDNFYAEGNYRCGKEKNNDQYICGVIKSDENKILAVYDGMGGESMGDMASLISSRATADYDGVCGDGEDFLNEMCLTLNSLVCEFAQSKQIRCTGSTAAIIRFCADNLYCCNLGDSSVFKITKSGIVKISEDHVVKNFPRKKAPLTQFIGMPTDEIMMVPYITKHDYEEGVMYLLCSDGITDMVTQNEIFSIVTSEGTVKEKTQKLVDKAMQNGGVDNITAIICLTK